MYVIRCNEINLRSCEFTFLHFRTKIKKQSEIEFFIKVHFFLWSSAY